MSQHHGYIGRRELLQLVGKGSAGCAVAAIGVLAHSQPAEAVVSTTLVSPEAALQQLLDGNQRFMQQQRQYPHQSALRLQEVAQAQHPFATILSCADSRVPAEIIFDTGIGDLFDIRIAGNIVTPEVLGSLEYAVAILKTPLILVLGHERCGAVTAAVQGEPLPGQIGTCIQAIKPAIAAIKNNAGDPVENGVIANVNYQVETMKRNSDLITQRLLTGKLKLMGARYDLDTGKVAIV